jgi:hypothetical protein
MMNFLFKYTLILAIAQLNFHHVNGNVIATSHDPLKITTTTIPLTYDQNHQRTSENARDVRFRRNSFDVIDNMRNNINENENEDDFLINPISRNGIFMSSNDLDATDDACKK